MKRKDAINAIKFIAYRDGSFATRIYIENRISHDVAQQAFKTGLAQRVAHIESGEFPKIANEHDKQKAIESLNNDN